MIMTVPLESILPDGWPRPKGYANGLRVPAGRDLVFVAGQVGWDVTETIVGPGFVEQFEQALRNCVAVVESAGGAPADIVRLTLYCTNKRDYLARLKDVGQSYRRVMGQHYPVMAAVEVSALMEDGAVVEVEATAAIAPSPGGAS